MTTVLLILALVFFGIAVFPQGRGQFHFGWAGAFVLALMSLLPKVT